MEKPVTGYLDRSNIRKIAGILRDGGIAVLPTDTIYGFHCAAVRPDAVERVIRLKGRREAGGFIVLASSVEMADTLVSRWPGESRGLLEEIWPAALTAILPSSSLVPSILSPLGKIAVRVPALEELRVIVASVGDPVVSTSVNLSGQRPITRIREIKRKFAGLDAYISKRGRPAGAPSTVVDFTVRPYSRVRSGRYAWP